MEAQGKIYTIDVAFLPSEALKEHDVRVVVDVLRATTQITTFFDCGGEVLIPIENVSDAFAAKKRLGDDWKIMGERGGLPVEGFDFGNSPLELLAAGAPKRAIITTSNGAKALVRAAADCACVIAGCARNAQSAAKKALSKGSSIGVVCAGRNGEFSVEDACCAGIFVEELETLAKKERGGNAVLTDGAKAAKALWDAFDKNIFAICDRSAHGKILRDLGFRRDILFCCERDASEAAPETAEYEGMTALTAK